MLFACSIGRRIGLVTIDPVFIPWHDEQVTRHGLSQRVGGVAAIKADLPRFMRAFTDAGEYAAVRADFIRQVKPLLERGCDVLIPAGGLPMLLFSQEQPFLIDGAVVLEGIATVMKATEMALALHRLTGVAASRSGLYARAPGGRDRRFRGARLDAEQRRVAGAADQPQPVGRDMREVGLAARIEQQQIGEAAKIDPARFGQCAPIGDGAGTLGKFAIRRQGLDRLLRGIVEQKRPVGAMLDQQQRGEMFVERGPGR